MERTAAAVSPIQWYLTVWKRYALFEGRSGRPEFWWFVLGQVVISFVLGMLSQASGLFMILWYIWALATIVPNLAVGARRLHDIGKSGWLQLVGLIPIVGLVLLYFWALPSQPGPNQYGEGPLPPEP